MKRILYMAFFFFLLVLTLFHLLRNRESTLGAVGKNLALPDPAAITMITLSGNGESGEVRLLSKQNRWLLNDSLPVKPGLAEAFLHAAAAIRFAAPVPEARYEILKETMYKQGTRAVFYSGKKIVRDYLLYSDSTGSYLISGSRKPPVQFSISGFSDNPLAIFNTHPSFWKDNILLTLPLEQLHSISLEYPEKPEASFILSRTGKNEQWKMSLLTTPGKEISPDTLVLMDFLKCLQRIPVTGTSWYNPQAVIQLYRKQVPFATLTLKATTNSQIVRFFKYFPEKEKKPVPDPDFCLAWSGSDSLPRPVKYFDIDDLLIEATDLLIR